MTFREELAGIIEFNARLSVLKKAIGSAKQQGGSNLVLRKGGRYQRHDWVGEDGMPTPSAYRWEGAPNVPPMPQTTGVSIAKGDGADLGIMSRTHVALHESGHAADKGFNRFAPRFGRIQTAMMEGRIAPWKVATKPRVMKAILASEQTANRAAIENLKNAGASSSEIASYKSSAKKAYKIGYKIPQIGIIAQAKYPKILKRAVRQGGIGWRDVRKIYEENPHLRTHAWQALTPDDQVLRMIARL